MMIRVHEGDLPNLSAYGDVVAVDTETLGLNPHRDRLCVVQLSPGDGTADVVRIAKGQTRAPNLEALLTDPNSAVACEVESTGVQGMVRFVTTPRPRLLLTGVPLADTVRRGQLVLTSGLSLRYPRGLPVGRVERLGRDVSGLTQEIELDPSARLSRLRHAYVVPGPALPGAPPEAGR